MQLTGVAAGPPEHEAASHSGGDWVSGMRDWVPPSSSKSVASVALTSAVWPWVPALEWPSEGGGLIVLRFTSASEEPSVLEVRHCQRKCGVTGEGFVFDQPLRGRRAGLGVGFRTMSCDSLDQQL